MTSLAFVIVPYLVLPLVPRHCLKDWSEAYQQQYSFWREEKAEIVLNNPFPQAAPLQAQPRGSNEEPDLAIGRPPGQAHWGGPHWPGKGDENRMILTMILTTKRITVMTTISIKKPIRIYFRLLSRLDTRWQQRWRGKSL